MKDFSETEFTVILVLTNLVQAFFPGFDDICMANIDGKYSLEQILHELCALNTEGMGGISTQKAIIKNNDKARPERWQSVVTLGKKGKPVI